MSSGSKDWLSGALQSAREQVQRCQHAPVDEAKPAFGAAMVSLVQARNRYLAAMNRAEASRDAELQQLNALLSLMASVEFPLAGFHRARMDQIVDVLDEAARNGRADGSLSPGRPAEGQR